MGIAEHEWPAAVIAFLRGPRSTEGEAQKRPSEGGGGGIVSAREGVGSTLPTRGGCSRHTFVHACMLGESAWRYRGVGGD